MKIIKKILNWFKVSTPRSCSLYNSLYKNIKKCLTYQDTLNCQRWVDRTSINRRYRELLTILIKNKQIEIQRKCRRKGVKHATN